MGGGGWCRAGGGRGNGRAVCLCWVSASSMDRCARACVAEGHWQLVHSLFSTCSADLRQSVQKGRGPCWRVLGTFLVCCWRPIAWCVVDGPIVVYACRQQIWCALLRVRVLYREHREGYIQALAGL